MRNRSFDDGRIRSIRITESCRSSSEVSLNINHSASEHTDTVLPQINLSQVMDPIKVDNEKKDLDMFKPKINSFKAVEISYRKFLKNVTFKASIKKHKYVY